MKRLCIVPCGSRKIWDKNPNTGPAKAKKVYIGPFAKKCREYAEKFYPSTGCIISAKYGFLFPDDVVPGNYDVSFKKRKTNPITIKELSTQAMQKGLDQYNIIVTLGGRDYVEMVCSVFPGKEIIAPLRGCPGIGYMLGKLNLLMK